jgi:hypothetical protein
MVDLILIILFAVNVVSLLAYLLIKREIRKIYRSQMQVIGVKHEKIIKGASARILEFVYLAAFVFLIFASYAIFIKYQ